MFHRVSQGAGSSQAPPSPDTTPDAFTFTDVTSATPSTLYASNAVTISGLNAPAAISISGGGEYRKNGGLWTSSVGTVSSGDVIEVRNTSSAAYSTTVNTVITIDVVTDTFSISTVPDPSGGGGGSFSTFFILGF